MVLIGPQLPPNGLPKLVENDSDANLSANQGQQATLQQVQLHAEPHGWPHSIGCGLKNLGNSCYLNSTLQCLTHLPPFANVCLEKDHSGTCKLDATTCTACILERQVINSLQKGKDGYPGIPREVWNCLNLFSRSFRQGRQEDAHELLRCMAEALERDMLKAAGKWCPGKPPKNACTLVNRIFQGCLQSQVRCLSCKHESNTYDPFMDLSLELMGSNSVRDALARFTRPERLDGDNRYRCEKCKQLVAAEKRLTIFDEPNALVVHLKRFDALSGIGKISRHISFEERMSMDPFMAPNRPLLKGNAGNSAYTLHGVVVHQGSSVQSGHYYSYVRDARTNQWFCMNDCSVYPVSLERLRTESVYMLFYTRTRMKPMRPIPSSTDATAGATPVARAPPATGPDGGPHGSNGCDKGEDSSDDRISRGTENAQAVRGNGQLLGRSSSLTTNGGGVYGPLPRSNSASAGGANGAAAYGPQPLARSVSGAGNGLGPYGPQPLARSNSTGNGEVNGNGAAVYGPQPLMRSSSGNGTTSNGAAVYGPQPLAHSNSANGPASNGAAVYSPQRASGAANGAQSHAGAAAEPLRRTGSGTANGIAAQDSRTAVSRSDVAPTVLAAHPPISFSLGMGTAGSHASNGHGSCVTRISAPAGGVVRSSSFAARRVSDPSGRPAATTQPGTAAAAIAPAAASLNGGTWGTVRRASADGASQQQQPQAPAAPLPERLTGTAGAPAGPSTAASGTLGAAGRDGQGNGPAAAATASNTQHDTMGDGLSRHASSGMSSPWRPGGEVPTLRFPAAPARPVPGARTASAANGPAAPARAVPGAHTASTANSSAVPGTQALPQQQQPASDMQGVEHNGVEASTAGPHAVSGRKRSRQELEGEVQTAKLGEGFQAALKQLRGSVASLLRSGGWAEHVRHELHSRMEGGATYDEVMADKAKMMHALQRGIAHETRKQMLEDTAALFRDHCNS